MKSSLSRSFPDVAWTDLQTRGLVVVPAFLSPDEVSLMLEKYNEEIGTGANTVNVYMDNPSLEAFYRQRLHEIVEHITRHTDVMLDTVTGGTYYALERGVNFGWHQDHISYYATNDHYNYINVWIPLKKPVRNQSGLSLLPWDALGERLSPELLAPMQRGGCRFILWSHVVDNDVGGVAALPCDVDEVAFTPDLEPGDALVLRGDMFHKTQDLVNKERIAVSVRVIYANSPVDRQRFTRLCLTKLKRMAGDRFFFTPILDEFKTSGKAELTAARAYELGQSHDKSSIEEQQRKNKLSMDHFFDSLATVMLMDAPGLLLTLKAFKAEFDRIGAFLQEAASSGPMGADVMDKARQAHGELKAALDSFTAAADARQRDGLMSGLKRLLAKYVACEDWIGQILFCQLPDTVNPIERGQRLLSAFTRV